MKTITEDYDDFEDVGFHNCPNCNRTYDEIDYDYQICSKCGWDANKKRFAKYGARKLNNVDYLNGDADILTDEFY